MSLLSCGNANILSGRIVFPRVGCWYASLRLDTTTAPTGAVAITSDDGVVSLSGYARYVGTYQGHVDVRVEGGGGGTETTLAAVHYRTPTLRVVLGDLLRDAGEVLDSTVSSALLATSLPAWSRRRATLVSLLGDVVRFGTPPGTLWRVLGGGGVWLGSDTYSGTPLALGDSVVMDTEPAELSTTLASDDIPIAILPGTLLTYDDTLPAGRVSSVDHRISAESVRSFVTFADPVYGDRQRDALSRIVAQAVGPMKFHATCPGTVVEQDSGTGAVDVQLDSPDSVATLAGLVRVGNPVKVPLRGFAPDTFVAVTAGARVLVGWEAGSPARPVIVAFDPSTKHLTSITFGSSFVGSPVGVARVGDSVDWNTSLQTWMSNVELALTALSSPIPPFIGTTIGDISSGSSRLRVTG